MARTGTQLPTKVDIPITLREKQELKALYHGAVKELGRFAICATLGAPADVRTEMVSYYRWCQARSQELDQTAVYLIMTGEVTAAQAIRP